LKIARRGAPAIGKAERLGADLALALSREVRSVVIIF
jgi:hypothetical protein